MIIPGCLSSPVGCTFQFQASKLGKCITDMFKIPGFLEFELGGRPQVLRCFYFCRIFAFFGVFK